ADLAINIDCFSYEGLLGTRSRLLEWMRAELPIATTELCEFSRVLARGAMAYSFALGDPSSLAATLVRAARDPEGRRERARKASAFLDAEYSNERLLAPLLRWAENPAHAPDIDPQAEHCRAAPFPHPDNALAEAQMESLDAGERRRAALARLQGSRLVRWIMKWKGFEPEQT
ncbi:MAG: hypothetical protein NTW86_14050, partial [Candidatus Sumerlaeota bacterium]|nr:hypothetical protein [Candidatus Sumerlaeota bacterium]